LKHVAHKLIFDPLDFLEYFCPAELDITKDLFGFNELKILLQKYTLCKSYAERIAVKHGIGYKQINPIVDSDLTAYVMAVAAPTTVGKSYLATRGIGLELARKYEIGFYSYEALRGFDFKSLSNFYLFNEEELEFCQHKFRKLGLEVDLKTSEYLVCVSRDKTGKINNLGFRVLNPLLETQVAKWLFSHGRQATFGLQNIEDRAIIVEGFFDSLALWECGYPAVGLGSAGVSPAHLEFLKNLRLSFLMDSDETGTNVSKELMTQGHRVLKLNSIEKDPFEAWIKTKTLNFTEWQ
jgi:hypothetical protein